MLPCTPPLSPRKGRFAGLFAGMPAPAAAVLCAVVSFYYGSRT